MTEPRVVALPGDPGIDGRFSAIEPDFAAERELPVAQHVFPNADRRIARSGTRADVARLEATGLNAYFGRQHAVKDVTLALEPRSVTAIIGPSGCGKSTLLRCLNRMHETVPGARTTGSVTLDGEQLYGDGTSAIAVRRHIGMVFQRPTPFPTMSIRDNVAAGLKIHGGTPPRARFDDIVEDALRRAALWNEVKDRLGTGASALSGGQQQRLCIARALATRPRVLLLDEPTASLDPASTQKIEELVYELPSTVTVGIVTHNMQQAARVSHRTAFMLDGELIETAPTRALFTAPRDVRTEAYITGRFG
ncbi:MAG TPA: phosphate ABC transporter ATP-binding protein PstB [Gemmatimonadaceae bacterium]|nr:phosphate ABC transporter ATP-binding protein PstB [Gemmatimonadaceae bacterium]